MNESTMVNVATTQRCRFYGSVSMNESTFVNVITTQRRRCYANIPMNIFGDINVLIVQRCRCCSFDSPGLARNEPTLGEYS